MPWQMKTSSGSNQKRCVILLLSDSIYDESIGGIHMFGMVVVAMMKHVLQRKMWKRIVFCGNEISMR